MPKAESPSGNAFNIIANIENKNNYIYFCNKEKMRSMYKEIAGPG